MAMGFNWAFKGLIVLKISLTSRFPWNEISGMLFFSQIYNKPIFKMIFFSANRQNNLKIMHKGIIRKSSDPTKILYFYPSNMNVGFLKNKILTAVVS